MISKEVIDYIKKCSTEGQTKEQIIESLTKNGWMYSDAEKAFDYTYPKANFVPPPPVEQVIQQSTNKFNNSNQEFQKKYPLSPKKFWKKIYEKFFVSFFFALPFGFGGIMIPFASSSHSNDVSITSVIMSGFIVLLIFWIIFLLLYAWYIRVYIRTYYYDASNNFLTIRKGVFTRTEIHVQYQKIQDVYVDQDIVDRILGIYDVHIASATATSGIEAHIDGVEKDVAESIKNYLLQKITSHSSNKDSQSGGSNHINSSIQTATFSSNERISSLEFPIIGAWLIKSIFIAIFSNLLLFLIFFRSFIGKDNNYPIFSQYIIPIFLVTVAGRIIYSVIWRDNYYFEFTKDFILIREKVISTSEKHVPYSTIQDVIKTQNFFDRIVGLSNVTIQNATQGLNANISIPGLTPANAEKLSGIIRGILMNKNVGSSSNGL